MTELLAIHDARQNFGGKATVGFEGENKVLYSYGTKVAYITYEGNEKKAVVLNTHSATTLRHIKEFLLQNGFKADSKKQIEKNYKL